MTLCHLSTFCAFLGIPFGNILAPLVIWSIKKKESAFVDYNGKEALNFQISMTIYGLVAVVLCFVFIGVLLLPVILIAGIVLTILAAIRSNNGEYYRYPVTIRLVT